MIAIFEPYFPFISFTIVIVFNLILFFKNVNWVILIVANLTISIILNFFGLGEYDLLTQFVKFIIDLLIKFWESIFKSIGDFFKGILPFQNGKDKRLRLLPFYLQQSFSIKIGFVLVYSFERLHLGFSTTLLPPKLKGLIIYLSFIKCPISL